MSAPERGYPEGEEQQQDRHAAVRSPGAKGELTPGRADSGYQRCSQSQTAQKSSQVGHVVDLDAGLQEHRSAPDHKVQQGEINHTLTQPANLPRRYGKQFCLQQEDQDAGKSEDRTRRTGSDNLRMDSGAEQVSCDSGEHINRDHSGGT